MKRRPMKRRLSDPFEVVRTVGLSLPNVELTREYDGSPILKAGGAFMASLASHPSAEANSLVVRSDPDDRDRLLEDAPETYYLTDYYRPHPVVLARLSQLDRDALHDLLSVAWRVTMKKARS